MKPPDDKMTKGGMNLKVLTVTLNPALDREMFIDDFQINKLHRIPSLDKSIISPGGKGVNVSIALAKFGVPSIAVGFLGGHMGRILIEELRKVSSHITTNFVFIKDETRENIVIIDEKNHTITEINSPGPKIEEIDLEHLMRRYTMSLSRVEVVVISGSIPESLTSDVYVKLVKIAKDKGKVVFMETRDKHISVLHKEGAIPDVVKPDFRMEYRLLGKDLKELNDFIEQGKRLLDSGAKLVVLSYHVDKDIIVTEDGAWIIKPKIGVDISHILGTGDTYMAAMVYRHLSGVGDMLDIGRFGYLAALAKTKKACKEPPSLEEIDGFSDKYVLERVI